MNKSKNKLLLSVGTLLLLGVAISGYFATNYMAKKIEADERSNLLLRAETIAALINKNDLSSLAGSSTDVGTLAHDNIKKALESVRNINTDTRFVYILGQSDGSQFFYADAESVISPDYSLPGDPYEYGTPIDIENYSSKVPYTKGPYTDAWGNWFSAFAPITAPDGTMLGQLGMDIESEKLLLRITIVKQATIIIFTLLFLSVLVVLILLRDQSLFTRK